MNITDCIQANEALELERWQEEELNSTICELHPHKRLANRNALLARQFFSLMELKY